MAKRTKPNPRHAHLVDVAPDVRGLLARYGLTRAEAAAAIGVSTVTLWRWLGGHKAMPYYPERIRAACRSLARRSGADRAG